LEHFILIPKARYNEVRELHRARAVDLEVAITALEKWKPSA
jgi:hypothetical protein